MPSSQVVKLQANMLSQIDDEKMGLNMMNRGKLVIVVMVTVGLVLASFAWWNRWSRSQRVITHWGPQAATVIRKGEIVELLWLGDIDSADTHNLVALTGKPRKIVQHMNITKAAGLIHARHQLLQDGAFNWEQPRPAGCKPQWNMAIRFVRGQEVATVVLDFHCQRALLLERNEEVGMQPIAEAMEKFLYDITQNDVRSTLSPADSQ